MSNMKKEFITSSTIEKSIALIAQKFIEKVNQQLSLSATVNILMSGGNTPKLLYKELIDNYVKALDWSACNIIVLDERYVPFDNERSNAGECYRNFVKYVSLKDFIYPDTSLPLEKCVSLFEESLAVIKSDGIHVALLGTANDGHIASIFPTMDILTQTSNCFACYVQGQNEKRISLNLSFINASKSIWMMALGENKKNIVKQAQSNEQSNSPVLSLSPVNELKWFITTNEVNE